MPGNPLSKKKKLVGSMLTVFDQPPPRQFAPPILHPCPGARSESVDYLYQGLIPKTNKLKQRKYKQSDPTLHPTFVHAQVCSRNT